MITGDLNIIDIQMVVQYRIRNLADFLFQVGDPGDPELGIRRGSPEGKTLRGAAEAALRQVVGQRSVDDVLTIRRDEVQAETRELLQTILNDYKTGMEVLQVQLLTVRPPDEVKDKFDDVVRARVDKESRINQAKAYREDILPRARGQAERTKQEASAFAAERIARAEGEADRFEAVLAEYQKSREVTRQRLYLEAMEEILPIVTKFVVTDKASGLLQVLPLRPDAEFPPQ